jgi:hypothetical protein
MANQDKGWLSRLINPTSPGRTGLDMANRDQGGTTPSNPPKEKPCPTPREARTQGSDRPERPVRPDVERYSKGDWDDKRYIKK